MCEVLAKQIIDVQTSYCQQIVSQTTAVSFQDEGQEVINHLAYIIQLLF